MIALAQSTGTLNEVSNAVERLSGLGFMGLVILLTLVGSLVVWQVYADKKRYDKANEREHERWDKQMENWREVYTGQKGAFDELKEGIKTNTQANDRLSDAFIRAAEHQLSSGQETAKANKQYLVTFAEVHRTLSEVSKTINRQADSTRRLGEDTRKLSEDTRKLSEDTRMQIGIISQQTEQNAGTLDLVKAFAAELSRHEKSAITRAEQIHIDFEGMRKDRQEHLDEMNAVVKRIDDKLDKLVESNLKLAEAVTALVKRSTNETAAVEPPADVSGAAA